MSALAPAEAPLPYTDTKPVGAPDFYCAVNATFRFLLQRFGVDGLRRYWTELGASYYRPVTQRWQQHGLPAVADYWQAFFQAEPGAEVEVEVLNDAVKLEVRTCPAISHLRRHGREIVPSFCQHCYFVSEAMAAPAGLTVRICGGNGRCTQHFMKRTASMSPQQLEDIASAS